MVDVGVRELKAKLSEYLDRAARGETIRVTDRGRAKAVLGPLPGKSRLEQGIAEGWIRAPSGRRLRPARPVRGLRPTAESFAEDRDDDR